MPVTTDINVIYLRVLERPYFKMKLISGVIVLSVFNGHVMNMSAMMEMETIK